MAANNTIAQRQFDVLVADDRACAWICLPPFVDKSFRPTRDEVCAGLLEAGLAMTADVDSRVETYVALFSGRSSGGPRELPSRFLIARGTPPREPREATITFSESLVTFSVEGADTSQRSGVVVVDAGANIGQWRSASAGEPGADVFGDSVPPATVARDIQLGDGLRREADGKIIAERAGRVVLMNNQWVVADAMVIAPENCVSRCVECETNCRVTGDLGGGATLKAAGGVLIDGAVEACDIEAGDDIAVRGGIFGRGEHGLVQTAGAVQCRFCDGAHIDARGDIDILNESVNSRLRAGGAITIRTGSVLGGWLHATCGGRIQSAGNETSHATHLSIGVPPDVLIEMRRLEEEIRRIGRSAEPINAKLQPLVANVKRLTPTQKEQMAGLLQEAKQISASMDDTKKRLAELQSLAASIRHARLHVQGVVHAGVRFRVGLREACMRTDHHGPLVLESRLVRGATELVMSFENGRSQVLSSAETPPDVTWPGLELKGRS